MREATSVHGCRVHVAAARPAARFRRLCCPVGLAAALTLTATLLAQPAPTVPDPPTAFVDVTVVPMNRDGLLRGRTVIVRDGRIAWIGPSGEARLADDVRRIDGRGRYLMPGLADMHVHVAPGEGLATDGAGRTLRLLLAHGVTTARSMIGHPSHVPLRDAVRSGARPGPTLIAAGPPLWGKDIATTEAARRVVAAQRAAGYDFVKVIAGFEPPVYDAILAAARDAGLPVGGHVSGAITLERALAAGQQIEHLDGFLELLVANGAPVTRSAGQLSPGAILDHLDETRVDAVARRIRDSGTYNSPTPALFERLATDVTADALAAQPEMRYVTRQALEAWRTQLTAMRDESAPAARRARFVTIRRRLVRALENAGAPLLAGSDSPQLFFVAGRALHEELAALVGAGLTPYQALRAATVTAAAYLGQAGQWGVVAEGARADLLLLTADPLADVVNASRIDGVMVRGRWFDATARARLFAEVEASALEAAPGGD